MLGWVYHIRDSRLARRHPRLRGHGRQFRDDRQGSAVRFPGPFRDLADLRQEVGAGCLIVVEVGGLIVGRPGHNGSLLQKRETHETDSVISPDSRPPLVPRRRPGGLRRAVEDGEDGNDHDARWNHHHDDGEKGQINRRQPAAELRGRDRQDEQVRTSY